MISDVLPTVVIYLNRKFDIEIDQAIKAVKKSENYENRRRLSWCIILKKVQILILHLNTQAADKSGGEKNGWQQ